MVIFYFVFYILLMVLLESKLVISETAYFIKATMFSGQKLNQEHSIIILLL